MISQTKSKGPETFPTIVVLGRKVESNGVYSAVFCADSESSIISALRSLFRREIDKACIQAAVNGFK